MIVLWGPDLLQFYNDVYRDIMGNKHPVGFGQPTRECWSEVWEFNQAIYERVLRGETLTFEDQLFAIRRYGYLEKARFTLCYSPLRTESQHIAGVLVAVFETTRRVVASPDAQDSSPHELESSTRWDMRHVAGDARHHGEIQPVSDVVWSAPYER